jgi:hypothetical protein
MLFIGYTEQAAQRERQQVSIEAISQSVLVGKLRLLRIHLAPLYATSWITRTQTSSRQLDHWAVVTQTAALIKKSILCPDYGDQLRQLLKST